MAGTRKLRIDTGTVQCRLDTGGYVVVTTSNGTLLVPARPAGLEPGQQVKVALPDAAVGNGPPKPAMSWVIVGVASR